MPPRHRTPRVSPSPSPSSSKRWSFGTTGGPEPEQVIQHSLPFGLYLWDAQVGFARVITDFTSFGYLADVFILEEHRGKGLSTWMMQVLFSHPELQGFRRWMLATRDAHGLYRQVGFTSLAAPERFMEKSVPDIYRRGPS